MKKNFNVSALITLYVEKDVEAETEEQAERIAREHFNDMYRLDVIGAYHDKDKDVKCTFNTYEYED